jgi:hypothetical protein
MPVMGWDIFKKLEKVINLIRSLSKSLLASSDDETKFKQLENGVNDYVYSHSKK